MSFERNRMHDMLTEMGRVVVDKLGPHKIFKLETIQANPLQVSQVLGGTVDATRARAVEIMRAHQSNRRDLVREDLVEPVPKVVDAGMQHRRVERDVDARHVYERCLAAAGGAE